MIICLRSVLLSGSGLGLMLTASAAGAQTSQQAASTGGGVDGTEIIVTATKRSESVQDVPIAVSVIRGDILTAQHITDGVALARQTPNMVATSGVGAAMPFLYIRGVGSGEFVTTSQPSIGVYRDEVYIASAIGMSEPVYDLQRVEVLRGPQGTLWGKNTTGGAIHYVTEQPSDTFKGRLFASYGSDDTREVEAGIGGPLADGLSFRVAGNYKARDGQIFNQFTGKKDGGYSIWDLRGHLRWEISPVASLQVTVHGGKSSQDLPFFHAGLLPGSTDFNGYSQSSEKNVLSNNSRHDTHASRFGVDAHLKVDLGFADLVNLTSYQYGKSATYSDDDGSPAADFAAFLGGRSRTYLDELRLSSPDDNRAFSWILGGFLLNDNTTALVRGPAYGVSSFPFGGFATDFTIKTKNAAAFGNLNYKITPRLSVGVGLRYTREKKILSSGLAYDYVTDPNDRYNPAVVDVLYIDSSQGIWRDSLGNPMAPPPSSRSWGRFTWDATVNYKATDNVMLFSRVARGFRSGNYNIYLAVPEDITSYEPETLTSYEAGIKSTLLDKRLTLNLTGFHYDLKNMQVTALTDLVSGAKVVNAASARMDGFEVEAMAIPTQGLTLSLGYGYVNARYHRFPNSSAPFPINFGSPLDVSGVTLGTPKHSLNLGANYVIDTGSGKIKFNTDWRYTSKQSNASWIHKNYSDLTPLITEQMFAQLRRAFSRPGAWLGNASVGYQFGEAGPELSLWVKNITKHTDRFAFPMFFNGSVSFIPTGDRDRTFGASLRYDF